MLFWLFLFCDFLFFFKYDACLAIFPLIFWIVKQCLRYFGSPLGFVWESFLFINFFMFNLSNFCSTKTLFRATFYRFIFVFNLSSLYLTIYFTLLLLYYVTERLTKAGCWPIISHIVTVEGFRNISCFLYRDNIVFSFILPLTFTLENVCHQTQWQK